MPGLTYHGQVAPRACQYKCRVWTFSMYPVEVQWHFQSHLMYHQESPWSSEGLNQALCQKKLVCVRVLKNMSMYLDNVSNTTDIARDGSDFCEMNIPPTKPSCLPVGSSKGYIVTFITRQELCQDMSSGFGLSL